MTIFFLLALMPWLDPPGVLSFNWDATNSAAILVSALLGFLLQWSGALALGYKILRPSSSLRSNLTEKMIVIYLCSATSATSHVVLGQFKTCVILVGGYVIFGSDPGVVSIAGAVLALCGMTIYTSLNLKASSGDHKALLANQTLSSLKPKSAQDEEKPLAEDNQNSV